MVIYLFIRIFACTGKNRFNINFDKSSQIYTLFDYYKYCDRSKGNLSN